MTFDECLYLLNNFKNPLVRIDPRGSVDASQHWGRGRLLGIRGDYATVQPMSHKRTEQIHLKYLKKWTSRLELKEGAVLTQNLGEQMKELLPRKGFFQKKYTDAQYEEVIRLYNMGKKIHEIEVISGVPRGSITTFLYSPKAEGRIKRRNKSKEKPRMESPDREPVTIPALPLPVPFPEITPPKTVTTTSANTIETKSDLRLAIRAMLDAPVSDMAKLLAIEALVS